MSEQRPRPPVVEYHGPTVPPPCTRATVSLLAALLAPVVLLSGGALSEVYWRMGGSTARPGDGEFIMCGGWVISAFLAGVALVCGVMSFRRQEGAPIRAITGIVVSILTLLCCAAPFTPYLLFFARHGGRL